MYFVHGDSTSTVEYTEQLHDRLALHALSLLYVCCMLIVPHAPLSPSVTEDQLSNSKCIRLTDSTATVFTLCVGLCASCLLQLTVPVVLV